MTMGKIAISLPDDILAAVENERHALGVTRSEIFRRAVEAFLQRQRDREAIESYVAGYRDQPETNEDLGLARGRFSGCARRAPVEREGPKVRRGELSRADLPAPAGRRPLLLLSRDEAYAHHG
jgi:predicted transcriptional regulator